MLVDKSLKWKYQLLDYNIAELKYPFLSNCLAWSEFKFQLTCLAPVWFWTSNWSSHT